MLGLNAANQQLWVQYNKDNISSSTYLAYNQILSGKQFDPNSVTVTIPADFNSSFVIGAFYNSQTNPTNDNSQSIANKTFTLLDASGNPITQSQLAGRDTDGDSKLTNSELNNLYAWLDSDEDGVLDTGEQQSLANANITSIREEDYAFFTNGNSKRQSATLPDASSVSAIAVPSSQSAPSAGRPSEAGSNYEALRYSDNIYKLTNYPGYWMDWTQGNTVYYNNYDQTPPNPAGPVNSVVKMNYNNGSPNSMVGTEGNDVFDVSYWWQYDKNNGSATNKFFDNSQIVNFYAGGGDDTMGGSSRNDSLWGGTGNDVVYGYAGDDKLYGEDGADKLYGQDGNDSLLGQAGNDWIESGTGNDLADGGEGADEMVAANDARYSLAA